MRSVWIEGEVTYDDVFGESYVSEFAFMTFAFCNDMESWIEMWGLQKALYVPVVVRPDTEQMKSAEKAGTARPGRAPPRHLPRSPSGSRWCSCYISPEPPPSPYPYPHKGERGASRRQF